MAVFNEDVYFANKLASLNATPGGTQYTDASMREAFSNAGLTAEQHYEQFGRDEQINPYAAGGLTAPTTGATQVATTPTAVQSQTFDEGIYWQNKADDLNANSQSGRTDWDATAVKNYAEDGGFTAQSHYDQFGKDEGISPYGYQEVEDVVPSLVNYGLDQIRPGSDYNTPATQSRDILSEMIDKNDPYMQSAVNYAQEAASGVGRVNSSYAAGAATRAAIDAAAPLAQQDALTAANFNINEQTASSGLVRDSVQNEYNINTASNLAEVNAASAAIADTSALVREQLVQDATMERLNVGNQNAVDAALLNADASATANFNTTYGSMSQQLTQGLASIDAANMDAPDALAAKNDLIATFNHNVLGLVNITNAGLNQYDITWEPNVSLEAGGSEVPLPETVDDVNTWNPTNENNR